MYVTATSVTLLWGRLDVQLTLSGVYSQGQHAVLVYVTATLVTLGAPRGRWRGAMAEVYDAHQPKSGRRTTYSNKKHEQSASQP
jgi:hypothetical protein